MTIYFRETPDKFIVSVTDARIVDESRIDSISQSLLDVSKQASDAAKRLVVDFRDVEFITSIMLGKLVQLNNLARQNSLDFRLANVNRDLREVFKVTRLNTVFHFDDDDPDLLGGTEPSPKPCDGLNP